MAETLEAALWFHSLRDVGLDRTALDGLIAVSRAQRLQLRLGGVTVHGDTWLLHMIEGEPERLDQYLATTSPAAWRGLPLMIDRRPILAREFRWWSQMDAHLTPRETAWLSRALARPPYDVEAIESLVRWAGYRAVEVKLGSSPDLVNEAPWIADADQA